MMSPLVTVIVPVRNEERYVERCLYSIASQTYARNLIETLVVDGRSDDATRDIITRFSHESTLAVSLFDNPKLLPAAAMNIGLEAARGDIIMRLDGHAALAPDYIQRCVDALNEVGADCAGGVLRNEGEGYMGKAIAVAMSSGFGVGGAAFRTGGSGQVDTVAFGAYRRDVFARIGRFAEDIERGEDDEFNYRLRDAGGTIILVPDAHVSYTVRGSLPALWRQYFGYGRAKPEVLLRHPAQVQARQLIPAAFAAALMYASANAISGRAGGLKLLAGVYTLAATFASLVLAFRHGWRRVPPLPAIFACLHVSYGLGFLAGLLGLAGRRAQSARSDAREGREAPNQ